MINKQTTMEEKTARELLILTIGAFVGSLARCLKEEGEIKEEDYLVEDLTKSIFGKDTTRTTTKDIALRTARWILDRFDTIKINLDEIDPLSSK